MHADSNCAYLLGSRRYPPVELIVLEADLGMAELLTTVSSAELFVAGTRWIPP